MPAVLELSQVVEEVFPLPCVSRLVATKSVVPPSVLLDLLFRLPSVGHDSYDDLQIFLCHGDGVHEVTEIAAVNDFDTGLRSEIVIK
jgi:hypothetical protein